MKLNRREFIKSVLAAAAVAQIPFTLQEAEAAYEHIGIDDCGNGWYRCWVKSVDYYDRRLTNDEIIKLSAGGEIASVYAKAGESRYVQLRHQRVRVWFNLKTGEIEQTEVVERPAEAPAVYSTDCRLWGMQTESSPDSP